MRVPIRFALNYGQRVENNSEHLDLVKIGKLEFSELSEERFPLLKLAYDVGRAGGILPAVMNGANERAVKLFLEEKISFLDIERLIFAAVENARNIENPTIEQIIESDRWAQEFVQSHCEG